MAPVQKYEQNASTGWSTTLMQIKNCIFFPKHSVQIKWCFVMIFINELLCWFGLWHGLYMGLIISWMNAVMLTKPATVHIPSDFVSHYCSRQAKMCSHHSWSKACTYCYVTHHRTHFFGKIKNKNPLPESLSSPLHHFTQTHIHT